MLLTGDHIMGITGSYYSWHHTQVLCIIIHDSISYSWWWQKYMQTIKKTIETGCLFLELHLRNKKSKEKGEKRCLFKRYPLDQGKLTSLLGLGIRDKLLPRFSGQVLLILTQHLFFFLFLDFSKAFAKPSSFCLLTCCLVAGEWSLGFWKLFVHLPSKHRI